MKMANTWNINTYLFTSKYLLTPNQILNDKSACPK